jgi:hypothetical protein
MAYYGLPEGQIASPYTPTLGLGQRVSLGFGDKFERWHKFGFNPAVSTTEESVVPYGGLANFPLVASYPGAQMEVDSSSTDDDGDPVGIGARTVTVYYLDSAGVEKTWTATMNGTTDVPSGAGIVDIWRINGFRVKTMGTSQGAVGTISLRELDDAPIFSQILPGATRAYNSQYTVPAGKRLMITDWSCTSGGVTQDKAWLTFKLMANKDYDNVASGVNLFEHSDMAVAAGTVQRHFESPISFAAGTDIVVNCFGVAATTAAQASTYLQGYLITV